MAFIEDTSENPGGPLIPDDYTDTGEIDSEDGDVRLVVGSAKASEAYLISKQWTLLWRDSDILYQSPRSMETYENTYVLSPNVQRFTVAKTLQSITPQLQKGLFYSDPPMVLRPRPGTSQDITDAKTVMASYLLEECKFKSETKWGLEQMGLLGTSIWKWGIEYKQVTHERRIASTTSIPQGPTGAPSNVQVALDELPKVESKTKIVPRPFFEYRPIERVLVDPKTSVGDITASKFVIDTLYLDYYDLKQILEGVDALPEDDPERDNWKLPNEKTLMSWWMPPMDESTPLSGVEQASEAYGIVHHNQYENIKISPDLLLKKFKVYEYWDKKRKIIVLDDRKLIYSGANKFKKIPFLSANWWNRPKAFYGMGLGLIVGQNQRVDQGTINSILKILSYGVNPIYLRSRDSNSPTQMIRTGLGRILSVDGPIKDAYMLMETPKVPSDIWAALQESEKATESTSGADQMLVQGSTAGPRTSMGRTAGGAGILAGASATRLDGPLDNFIDQVFRPFLYILDDLVKHYLPDSEIMDILGQELGQEYTVNLQEYHDAKVEYEVLAGSSLAAKRTMAQSLTLIGQFFQNPDIQEKLATINQEYINWKEILDMFLEASEWKNKNDIIKKMTPDMIQRHQQQQQAAQAQGKIQGQMQLNQQKADLKAQQDQQSTSNRITRDLVVNAFRAEGGSEAVEGVPAVGGEEGTLPNV